MKVKMLKTVAGPNGCYVSPFEYDVDQNIAIDWAANGVCALLEEPVTRLAVDNKEQAIVAPKATRKVVSDSSNGIVEQDVPTVSKPSRKSAKSR